MSTVTYKISTTACLIFSLLALSNVTQAGVTDTPDVSVDQARQVMIPPAPPGPYLSTGLDENNSAKKPSAPDRKVENRSVTRPVLRSRPTEMPFAATSPDIPWPDNIRPANTLSPDRWTHTNNKQVRPTAVQEPRVPTYRKPAASYPVYSRSSNINVPYMNKQQPFMPNFDSPAHAYQVPNRSVPQNSYPPGYPSKYPMNRAPVSSDYRQGYPN